MMSEKSKENWLKKAWKWLDGRKTGIGSTMLIGSRFFKKHTFAYKFLFYGGSLLTGTGISHKYKKFKTKRK